MRNTREFELPEPLDREEATTAQIALKVRAPRAPPQRAHVLVLRKGPGAPGRIELKAENLVLGRSVECDLSLDSEEISRQHARFTRIDQEYQVEDLGSRNGIYLNGVRIHLAVLREGDELHLGNLVFEYREGA